MGTGAHERPSPGRIGLLILGAFALAAGVAGGLARLGYAIPVPTAAALHGALMVSGFLGTVISLERAIAFGHPLGYAAPLAAGLGTLAMLAGFHSVGRALWLLAPLALLATSLAIVRRQAAPHTVLLAIAALAWGIGNAFFLLEAWLAFLVLTIAAERLEMTRLVRRPRWAQPLFLAIVALMPFFFHAALVALALWLVAFDIARRTIRNPGLPRFAAVALLAGYGWLIVGGLAGGDIGIHAVTLGFVFSMIFAHAPIIVPVVTRTAVRFTPLFYGPLALLHASLLLRIEWKALGGALNALAIALFIATLLASMRRRG